MTDNFDLYEELGVSRDADEPTIRKAYRDQAKKTHPNNMDTGSAEAFERTHLALVVLTDPEKRKRYDDTGDATCETPDNARSNAMGIIERHVEALVGSFLNNSKASEAHDPRRRDLVREIRGGINEDIAKAKRSIVSGKVVVEFYRDMAGRFTSRDPNNFLAVRFERKARDNEALIETFENAIRDSEMAIEILASCSFRFDDPLGFGLYRHIG